MTISEPIHNGAIVEDADGLFWRRCYVAPDGWRNTPPWRRLDGTTTLYRHWSEIAAVSVLFDGVAVRVDTPQPVSQPRPGRYEQDTFPARRSDRAKSRVALAVALVSAAFYIAAIGVGFALCWLMFYGVPTP